MVAINIKADLKGVHRAFINLKAKQAPFATALALTTLAKGAAAAERDEAAKTFDTPTPFTLNAFRVQPATKSNLVAVIAVKDVQAEYLEPYVVGGDRYLGKKKGMLAPRNVALNQYGNLSRGKIRALQAKPNVYVGKITTKSGRVISGVWQRPGPARKGKSAGPIKLLIRFEDTTPAPKHLAFVERATSYVRANAVREFQAAMRKAMATAR
jgi:hypothetical protein